jgi:hypothetical protein
LLSVTWVQDGHLRLQNCAALSVRLLESMTPVHTPRREVSEKSLLTLIVLGRGF